MRTQKILEVENQLVSNEKGAFWCFCVKYIGSQVTYQKKELLKKDYKNELDEATFKVFSKLREARKKLVAEDAVPAYAVATDQELAEIAKLDEISVQSLLTMKGFGQKKV
ncbi:MAG: HRDC domain-containing protein [Bacteroidales bacterium]|nr:HRDC domain-containing protein [Bacteroidales bacterium]